MRSMPKRARSYRVAAVAIISIYPFLKRFTHLPQIVLGLAWGWTIPMAFAAQAGTVPPAAWTLVIGIVCWTMVFDTFYAMVDREDDLKIGIKSTAILFGRHDLAAIALLQIVAVLSIVATGLNFGRGWVYYLGVAAVAGLFLHQLHTGRRRDREGAFKAFMDNRYIGATLFAAIALDYLVTG